MATVIVPGQDPGTLREAVDAFRQAKKPVALTGAGISVESGIPDFRSAGGLWEVFRPEEYATIDVFLQDPAKAWGLYRAIGETIQGAAPNPGHRALAELEAAGRLSCLVTQNIDGLHQDAGSRSVIEIHGDHRHLQCLTCDTTIPLTGEHGAGEEVPCCAACGAPLKPNVVLFGEGVRHLEDITAALAGADLMLVVGTSAQVAPASTLPSIVKQAGGLLFEFNMEETTLTTGQVGSSFSLLGLGPTATSDFLIKGPAGETLPEFVRQVLA